MTGQGGDKELEKAMAEALEAVEERERHPASPDDEVIPPEPPADVEQVEEHQDEAPAEESPSPEETSTAEAEPGAGEEIENLKAQLIRVAADFDNFRKRARRDQEQTRKLGNEQLLGDILPVIDNLARALDHAEDDNPVAQGVQMVVAQFESVLENYGVRPIEAANKPFDPQHHEAMAQVPTADVESGMVVEELERGYMLHDRLLRPAKVVVATALPEEPTPEN